MLLEFIDNRGTIKLSVNSDLEIRREDLINIIRKIMRERARIRGIPRVNSVTAGHVTL